MLLFLINRDPVGKYCDSVSGKYDPSLWPCIPPSGSGSVSSCIDFHFSAALFGLLLIVWCHCQNEKEPRLHTSQTSIISFLKSRWNRKQENYNNQVTQQLIYIGSIRKLVYFCRERCCLLQIQTQKKVQLHLN